MCVDVIPSAMAGNAAISNQPEPTELTLAAETLEYSVQDNQPEDEIRTALGAHRNVSTSTGRRAGLTRHSAV